LFLDLFLKRINVFRIFRFVVDANCFFPDESAPNFSAKSVIGRIFTAAQILSQLFGYTCFRRRPSTQIQLLIFGEDNAFDPVFTKKGRGFDPYFRHIQETYSVSLDLV
jgi:hypothetical protein